MHSFIRHESESPTDHYCIYIRVLLAIVVAFYVHPPHILVCCILLVSLHPSRLPAGRRLIDPDRLGLLSAAAGDRVPPGNPRVYALLILGCVLPLNPMRCASRPPSSWRGALATTRVRHPGRRRDDRPRGVRRSLRASEARKFAER